jgi:predicted transcriptional regulator
MEPARFSGFDKSGPLHYIVVHKKERVMTTLTIRMSDELRTELDEVSREEHKAVSDIVRESLRRYIAIEKFRSVRRKVLPFAEAQGLLTDEDVFKALS